MKDKKFDFELNEEELQIERYIEAGDYVSLKESNPIKFEEIKEVSKIAAINTSKELNKRKKYTLNLNENDINVIKRMAYKEGLPYQTFISSLIHKIATKQIEV
jgi:predicted DNA binding CopG/RHH family protein